MGMEPIINSMVDAVACCMGGDSSHTKAIGPCKVIPNVITYDATCHDTGSVIPAMIKVVTPSGSVLPTTSTEMQLARVKGRWSRGQEWGILSQVDWAVGLVDGRAGLVSRRSSRFAPLHACRRGCAAWLSRSLVISASRVSLSSRGSSPC